TDVVIVGNTGDDDVFHGLHVSPDLDTVTYTLAGAVGSMGWGLAGDTFRTLEAYERYGEATWFRLGDADLATHLYRTSRLREGATLTEVTAEIALAWEVKARLLPMSDDRVATVIDVVPPGAGGIEVSCAGVASIYADICGTLLVDETDADRTGDVEAHGVRAAVAPILMGDVDGAERLARRALDLVG